MVSAVVLAAGASRRMGQPKPLVKLGDKTILQRVLDGLHASSVHEIVVVLGHRAEQILPTIAGYGCRVVINPHYRQGLSSSIRRGLSAVDPQAEGVLIALGDLPFVSSAVVEALLAAFSRGKGRIIVPIHEGRRGHPIVFGRKYWPELFRLSGDVGGRELLFRYAQDVMEVQVDEPGIFRDIDRLEELSS
jgi:molybdenum cofactor cytidylyltransferase